MVQTRRVARFSGASVTLAALLIVAGGPGSARADGPAPTDIGGPHDDGSSVLGSDELTTTVRESVGAAVGEEGPRLVPHIEIDLEVFDIVVDPVRDQAYVWTDSDDPVVPDTIAVVDTTTGEVLDTIDLPGAPTALAVAPDGSALYVGHRPGGRRPSLDPGSMVQFELPDLTSGWTRTFPNGHGGWGTYARDIVVAPDDPGLVVVTTAASGFQELMALRDGVKLPSSYAQIDNGLTIGPESIQFGDDQDTLYGFAGYQSSFGYQQFAIDANGVTHLGDGGPATKGEWEFADGRIFDAHGAILDPTPWPPAVVGQFDDYEADIFDYSRAVAIEPTTRRANLAEVARSQPDRLVVHDLDTEQIAEVWNLPDDGGFPWRLRTVSEAEGVLAYVTGWGSAYLLFPGALRGSNGEFSAVTPARVLDTRTGEGTSGMQAPVGPGESIEVQITGRGSVPAVGVKAVVMNVTAVSPTAGTYLSIYPTGIIQPTISNLNTDPATTRPNLVTVRVGEGGKVTVFNAAGDTHVLFDVAGYYTDHDGPDGSRFRAIDPVRLADTRSGEGGIGAGRLGPDETRTITTTGIAGIPADGPTAVVLNVTVDGATSGSYLTVSPADGDRPNASNLNFTAGDTVANQVIVRVPADGTIDLYNSGGQAHVIVDIVGYYEAAGDEQRGRFFTTDPFRAFDTRIDVIFPAPGDMWDGDILYYGYENETLSAYVVNVTATGTTGSGYIVTYPYPGTPPPTSTVNYRSGDTIANHAIITTGPYLGFLNETGRTHLIADIAGAFS